MNLKLLRVAIVYVLQLFSLLERSLYEKLCERACRKIHRVNIYVFMCRERVTKYNFHKIYVLQFISFLEEEKF